MEPPLPSLSLFLLCFVFFISAFILVDSQSQDPSISHLPPSPLLLTPPPPRVPPPPVRVGINKAIHEKHNHRRRKWRHRKKQKLNTGKTVGLFFAGVAAALQVVVAAFLLFKRRQLLLRKINDTH
uniref:Transmembrane protein n=1 Tax=Noccaea caerulescens TaxID=107243 RepID=A0A1J3JLC7_NOCCA